MNVVTVGIVVLKILHTININNKVQTVQNQNNITTKGKTMNILNLFNITRVIKTKKVTKARIKKKEKSTDFFASLEIHHRKNFKVGTKSTEVTTVGNKIEAIKFVLSKGIPMTIKEVMKATGFDKNYTTSVMRESAGLTKSYKDADGWEKGTMRHTLQRQGSRECLITGRQAQTFTLLEK